MPQQVLAVVRDKMIEMHVLRNVSGTLRIQELAMKKGGGL